jgi:hypothetical protein
MAFGQKTIYALFDRDTPNEKVEEITFEGFLERLAAGYAIVEKTPKRIRLVKESGKESRSIYVYLPE